MENLKDLETKGFVIIPNFFDKPVLDQIIADYNTQKIKFINNGSTNKNYKTFKSKHFSSDYFRELLKLISENTNITVNIVRPFPTYFDNKLINFQWHQDHEPYFKFQDMYNAINFWIPIIKNDKTKSGLGIIPQDVLASCCPEIFKKHIIGQGAKSFYLKEGVQYMQNDQMGSISRLPIHLEDIAVYPEIKVNDLVILRQDVIHRTADSLTDRIAISIRSLNKDTVLTKSHFLTNCQKKQEMMDKNPRFYTKLYNKFITEDYDEILISDII
jgi:hypothetical protein